MFIVFLPAWFYCAISARLNDTSPAVTFVAKKKLAAGDARVAWWAGGWYSALHRQTRLDGQAGTYMEPRK